MRERVRTPLSATVVAQHDAAVSRAAAAEEGAVATGEGAAAAGKGAAAAGEGAAATLEGAGNISARRSCRCLKPGLESSLLRSNLGLTWSYPRRKKQKGCPQSWSCSQRPVPGGGGGVAANL